LTAKAVLQGNTLPDTTYQIRLQFTFWFTIAISYDRGLATRMQVWFDVSEAEPKLRNADRCIAENYVENNSTFDTLLYYTLNLWVCASLYPGNAGNNNRYWFSREAGRSVVLNKPAGQINPQASPHQLSGGVW